MATGAGEAEVVCGRVNMFISRCDCPESVAAGFKALVDVQRGQTMTEESTIVRCTYCKKILKYYGTVEYTNPSTGERGNRTVLLWPTIV